MNNTEQLKNLYPFACLQNIQKKNEEFHALFTQTVVDTVKSHSLARKMCEQIPNHEIMRDFIPKHNDFGAPIFVLPCVGYVPICFNEGREDEISIPTFKIGTSIDVKLDALEQRGFSLVKEMMSKVSKALLEYEAETLMRVLVPAATSKEQGDPDFLKSEFLTLGLIEDMQEQFEDLGNSGSLTHILLPEKLAKKFKKKKIILESGQTLEVIGLPQLNKNGKYNIVDHITSKQLNEDCVGTSPIFSFDERGGFNDLTFDEEYPIQVYAFNKEQNPLCMPIKNDLSLWQV